MVSLQAQKELINQSWRRCHQYGLSPNGPINDCYLTGNELKRVIKEHKYLIRVITSILEKHYSFIQSNGLVTVITDQKGTIIHKVGRIDIDDTLDNMFIGSNWSEEIKGTNAIGLAIYEQKPIITHGEHHFHIDNHYLTCAASPIYSTSGEFIGAVNISAKKELFHPFTISLVSMMAEAIQNRLLLDQANREMILALRETEHTFNICTNPHLTLDHERRIIRANSSARQILGEDCIGKEFHSNTCFSVDVLSDHSNKVFRSVVSLQQTRKQTSSPKLYTISDMIGSSREINQIRKIVKKAALTDYPIIIYGESGTGKELIAHSLHTAGLRNMKPFIAVNCSAIPDSLIESELFGYEKGAFTGANKEGAPGKFEAADGGTLFLDEIGDMPLKAQAALLRVLQEKTVTRIGGDKVRIIDTRVVAATNKNLREEVKAGRFREDLYYRLTGIYITIPPLRERPGDILELTEHLIKKLDSPSAHLSAEAKQKLMAYHWPGNIRELNSVLMQAIFFAEDHFIQAEEIQFINEFEKQAKGTNTNENTAIPLINTEKEAIKKALLSADWNISKAAQILKISRNTLYNKIKKYELHQ